MRRPFFTAGQRVALFGGSFDPPHDGHRLVAEAAFKALKLDFVWWLVAPQNPLKAHQPSAMEQRLAATRKLASHPKFMVTDEETRLGTKYAVDTIGALKARHPNVHFVWLMGADNLVAMHRWKHWQKLMQSVPIAVYPRPGASEKAAFSPAATRFSATRINPRQAQNLALMPAPAWVMLDGVRSPLASSSLRNNTLGDKSEN